MVEWAFREYFKTGTFPPKPGDITKLIREKRASMMASTHQPTSEEEWDGAQKDRQQFFNSKEYKDWLDKMNKVIPPSPRRQELQEQLQQLAEKRNAKPETTRDERPLPDGMPM